MPPNLNIEIQSSIVIDGADRVSVEIRFGTSLLHVDDEQTEPCGDHTGHDQAGRG
jgi:hypothetical protein